MKKKILYIHHGKGLGGAPLSLLYLIQNLDKDKFEPVVLFLHDSEAVELYRSKNINIAGIVGLNDFPHTKIYWFKFYNLVPFFRSVLDSLKTRYFVAKKWIKQINPDLVHLNTSSLIVWAKVAKNLNIPVVFHVREPLANGYLGIRKRLITRWVERYSDAITPICKNDAKPWFNSNKVTVINNAVDHNKFNQDSSNQDSSNQDFSNQDFSNQDFSNQDFSNQDFSNQDFLKKYNLNIHDPKILFLGGLSFEKGTLQILKIFEQLLGLIPDAKLIVAGYFDLSVSSVFNLKRYFPDQRYKLKVRKVLKKISKSVIFTGVIKDVENALGVCDVLAVPFLVGHFARPIIEAGFMAKPVIASKIAPLDELMIHGQTGYLFDLKNRAAWVEKLYALITNKKLNDQIGKKAYDFCIKNFNVNDHAHKFEKIYQNILNGF
ncbi:MAG: glycosyltransferase family 4 protein [bacterium]